MKQVTAKETAQMLLELFNTKFGGKTNGRFQISRKHLLLLSGYKLFPTEFLSQLTLACIEVDLQILDIGHSFAVMEFSVLEGYRNVPPAAVEKILKI